MFCIENLLSGLFLLPIIGVVALTLVHSSNYVLLKQIALNVSCLTFVLSLFIWVFFNKSIGTFQMVSKFFWIPILNINFPIGIDGISLFFLLLTTLLIPICLLTSWNVIKVDLKNI